jgi:hypothetical protein
MFRRMLAYRAAGLPLTQDVFVLTFTGSLWLVCLVMALALLAASFRLASLHTAKLLSGQPKSWTWVEITLWAVAATCQQGRAVGHHASLSFHLTHFFSQVRIM